MLKVSDLHVNYGGINALRGIDIEVEENQIVTLIGGANGAGKSSTLRAIMNLVEKSQGGKVEYNGGEDLSNMETKDIVKKGNSIGTRGKKGF